MLGAVMSGSHAYGEPVRWIDGNGLGVLNIVALDDDSRIRSEPSPNGNSSPA